MSTDTSLKKRFLSLSNVNLMILSFSFGTHLFIQFFSVLIDLLLCTIITISFDTDSRVQVLQYSKGGKKTRVLYVALIFLNVECIE